MQYLEAAQTRCEEQLVLADGSHFFELAFSGAWVEPKRRGKKNKTQMG